VSQPATSDGETPAAIRRLSALAPLDDAALAALEAAIRQAHPVAARRDLVVEGKEIAEPKLIVSGWAMRVRLLADGRRQVLSFLLPGDLIGYCRHRRPIAVSTVLALQDLLVCAAPTCSDLPELEAAYATSAALEEAYLLAHIMRLGRLTAQERIYDLLLEFRDRLALAGLAQDETFSLPLTQEMLADALGLTAVHINRMLQLSRSMGDLRWTGRSVTLVDPDALAERIGYLPPRVSLDLALPARPPA
jgi:CRP-like cAMP-binding protein